MSTRDDILAGLRAAAPVGDLTPEQLLDQHTAEVRQAVLLQAEARLRNRAGELSQLAEEEMRRDLEEQAQEWHDAATAVAELVDAAPAESGGAL